MVCGWSVRARMRMRTQNRHTKQASEMLHLFPPASGCPARPPPRAGTDARAQRAPARQEARAYVEAGIPMRASERTSSQRRIGSKTQFPRYKTYPRQTHCTNARHHLGNFDMLPPGCEFYSPESPRLKPHARTSRPQEDVPLYGWITFTIKPRDETWPVCPERRGRGPTCTFEFSHFFRRLTSP